MRYSKALLGLLWAVGACARDIDSHRLGELVSSPIPQNSPNSPEEIFRDSPIQKDRRDTYPINCHIHNWPSASVDSVKEAYSWFYQLWAPLEADAQHCRRVACYGASAVWLCADTLGYQAPNSVMIADAMNELLDGDHGCLDHGNKNKVQGQIFTSEGWNVIVRGGENCSVEPPEQPLFY